MTDRAEIDRILDAAKHGVYDSDDIPDLIAEVEALRARVAEMLDGEMKLSRRAEAAEAHAVELAGRAALAAAPTKEPAP